MSLANETTLSNRRVLLGHKFIAEMADTREHPLLCLVSTAEQRTNPYNPRPGSSRPLKNKVPENSEIRELFYFLKIFVI